MVNFWQKLKNKKKPIYALAPMADITDSAFRQMCFKYGADVLYSEMASATALFFTPEKTLEMLKRVPKEKPYVVQLFGANPEHFKKAVKIIEEKINPEGIDINFGCPAPKVAKQGAGAVLAQNLELSKKIIKTVIDSTILPVSIKLRAKSGEINCLQFLEYMKDLDIKAIMIHGRTLSQGFIGGIDTEIIKKARDKFNGIILANGGMKKAEDAPKILKLTQADGIGIARSCLGKPWIFKELKKGESFDFKKNKIFKIAKKHAKLAQLMKGEKGIIEMRKHLCWYIQGLPNSRKMREELVQVNSLKDIKKVFNKF